jgi:hypothetical protein
MTQGDFEPAAVLLGGLPSSGKTTYLALLYLAIVEGRANGLALGTYADDREYLNEISGQLQRCRPTIHTKVDEQGSLSLSLLVGDTERPILLTIPDISGETWEAALTERQLTNELDQRARAAVAVMIFVHAKLEFDSGTTIVEANAADKSAGVAPTEDPGIHQLHHRSPTQVELVDLFQILREERGPRPARACIVISAFDLVPKGVSPQDWVSSNLPLLHQYLDVNSSWLKAATFGISAQGGSFADDESIEVLTKQDALDRSSVFASDGAERKVEDPILWALGSHG